MKGDSPSRTNGEGRETTTWVREKNYKKREKNQQNGTKFLHRNITWIGSMFHRRLLKSQKKMGNWEPTWSLNNWTLFRQLMERLQNMRNNAAGDGETNCKLFSLLLFPFFVAFHGILRVKESFCSFRLFSWVPEVKKSIS